MRFNRSSGPYMCQVSELCTLLLRYNMIQQHPLGPIQGHRVLHQLHTVIQQGATYTDHSTVFEECSVLSQPWWSVKKCFSTLEASGNGLGPEDYLL